MIVKNAVHLEIKVGGYDDEDVIARLRQIVTDFQMEGVRSWVSSYTGIVNVDRRDVTKEQYIAEVHEAAAQLRAKRAESDRNVLEQGSGDQPTGSENER